MLLYGTNRSLQDYPTRKEWETPHMSSMCAHCPLKLVHRLPSTLTPVQPLLGVWLSQNATPKKHPRGTSCLPDPSNTTEESLFTVKSRRLILKHGHGSVHNTMGTSGRD